MRAEMTRETPHLDCLYDETGWMAMELYRHKTTRASTGGWLCQTYHRPAEMNAPYKIMNRAIVACSVVDLVTELEYNYPVPW